MGLIRVYNIRAYKALRLGFRVLGLRCIMLGFIGLWGKGLGLGFIMLRFIGRWD